MEKNVIRNSKQKRAENVRVSAAQNALYRDLEKQRSGAAAVRAFQRKPYSI